MDHRKSYKLMRIGIVAGAIIVFTGLLVHAFPIFWTGIGIMVASTIQAWIFWKCPFCGRRLNVRGTRPDYCPFCRQDLGFGRDDEDDQFN